MAKRQYNKKNLDYWNSISKSEPEVNKVTLRQKTQDFTPQFIGSSYSSVSSASRTSSDKSGSSSLRRNRAAQSITPNKYGAILDGDCPYHYEKTGVNIRDAINLCQHAYAKVPIVRNSVDLMAEFANGEIFLEGGNEASRQFFEAWFSVIKLFNIKAQYFLEYYRGSNIFIYKNRGKLSANAIKKLSQYMDVMGRDVASKEIPIEYILLNPVDIVAENTSTFAPRTLEFSKVLSKYELERLKNPSNPVDEAILETFSEKDKKAIMAGNFLKDGIRIKLDPKRLIFSFAKKQDYEPFAVPFIFPVLSDVNMKLELKKLDQAVMRTIENVVLLITMGAKPDEGGINPANIEAMQNLFANESVGRVLIADYTTKGEFIIPDISKVVGKEKYEVLNEDIKEGLQNIVTGDDKYAATAIKAQLFLERLSESRTAFLNDFLIPQMYEVANQLGFKNVPTPRFRETTLKDEVQFNRAITRLIELSVLTPEQGIEAMKNGRLPNTDEFEEYQKQYKKQKDSGLYVPLIGGTDPSMEAERLALEEKSVEAGIQAKKAQQKAKAPKESGRPTGSKASLLDAVGVTELKEAIYKTDELFSFAKNIAIEKNLNQQQRVLINSLCNKIIESCDSKDWKDKFKFCLENPNEILNLNTKEEIVQIAEDFNISSYEASLLFYARNIQE